MRSRLAVEMGIPEPVFPAAMSAWDHEHTFVIPAVQHAEGVHLVVGGDYRIRYVKDGVVLSVGDELTEEGREFYEEVSRIRG